MLERNSIVRIFLFLAAASVCGTYATLHCQTSALKAKSNSPVSSSNLLPLPSKPNVGSITDEYLLNPDDVLDVYVYDVPELSHSYTVSPSGTITMPLLPDPLKAAGLNVNQLARAMEEAFRKSGRLRRPEIAISVKQSRSLLVTVDGPVKSPQVLTEIGPMPLSEILTQCGGLTDEAGTTLTLARGPLGLRVLSQEGGPPVTVMTLELKKVMNGADPASSTTVWPGDHVTVEHAGVYYVLGEVRSPGGFTLKNGHQELTVLRALALAGDTTSVAKKNKAVIIRNDPNAPLGREEIKINLESILAGHSPDPVLQANDILFVPGSGGKKALHSLTTVPATALGQAGAAAIIVH